MKRIKYLAALLAAVGILMQPQAAVNAAQSAMRAWAENVAPSLFPFLALMPVLTGPEACAAYEALFSGIMRPVFGLPGSAAPAVIIGMVAGSPGGAAAVTRIAAQTNMPARHSRRIALAVCGVSPSYLILGVGQGLYGSAQLGMRLAAIQAGVQLALLFLLRPYCRNMKGSAPQAELRADNRPIRAAVETMLAVCGSMVFFSVLAGVAATFTGRELGRALLLAMDLPSGMPQLAQWNIPWRMQLQGLAVGFGGICIGTQNLDALRSIGVKPGEYFAVRCMAGGLSAAASGLAGAAESAAAGPAAEKTYAAALLFALLAAVPALILFTKNIFLNKTQVGKTCQGKV